MVEFCIFFSLLLAFKKENDAINLLNGNMANSFMLVSIRCVLQDKEPILLIVDVLGKQKMVI